MIWLAVAAGLIALFIWALRAFANASVADVKVFLRWLAALAGLSIAVLLALTGRGAVALFSLIMVAPLLWEIWLGPAIARRKSRARAEAESPRRATSGMTREEACAILGVPVGATEAEIRAAHHRLMAAVHPDKGGSHWIASQLNQARDVLLG